jgi:hypothetical protein
MPSISQSSHAHANVESTWGERTDGQTDDDDQTSIGVLTTACLSRVFIIPVHLVNHHLPTLASHIK